SGKCGVQSPIDGREGASTDMGPATARRVRAVHADRDDVARVPQVESEQGRALLKALGVCDRTDEQLVQELAVQTKSGLQAGALACQLQGDRLAASGGDL